MFTDACRSGERNEYDPVHRYGVIGLDLYNQTLTGGVSMTLTAKSQDPHHVPCVLVLNDRGGRMDISIEVTGTLRAQDHGHPPLIFDARGNGGEYRPDPHGRSPKPGDGLHGDSGAV